MENTAPLSEAVFPETECAWKRIAKEARDEHARIWVQAVHGVVRNGYRLYTAMHWQRQRSRSKQQAERGSAHARMRLAGGTPLLPAPAAAAGGWFSFTTFFLPALGAAAAAAVAAASARSQAPGWAARNAACCSGVMVTEVKQALLLRLGTLSNLKAGKIRWLRFQRGRRSLGRGQGARVFKVEAGALHCAALRCLTLRGGYVRRSVCPLPMSGCIT